MKEIKISLCMLNYYEDYLCAKVVSQVYPFIDEIIIGDGSEGKDLLRDFMKGCSKVKVVDLPNLELRRGKNFNLSEVCNYIQTFATGNWVLWQDPDELYPYKVLENLRRWIKQFPEVDAFAFLRCDPKDAWRRTWNKEEPKVRLWKNKKGINWEGIAHHYPKGFHRAQLIAVRYWHDGWATSAIHHIYLFKDKEKQGTLTKRNREKFVEPFRDKYPEEEREKRMRSRE